MKLCSIVLIIFLSFLVCLVAMDRTVNPEFHKNQLKTMDLLFQSCDDITKRQGDADSLKILSTRLLNASTRFNNYRFQGLAYKYLGISSHFKSDYPLALRYYSYSKKYLEQAKEYLELANIHNNIGVIFLNNKQFDKALIEYQQSLTLREKYANSQGLETIYINLGNLYTFSNNTLKADSMYHLAYEYSQKNHNIAVSINALNNLIVTNNTLQRYSKAKTFGDLALEYEQEFATPQYEAATYNNLGSLYEEMKVYSKSIENYTKSLKIKSALNDKNGMIKTNVNIANVYLSLNKPEQAQVFIDTAIKLSDEENNADMPLAFYLTLSDLYKKNGKYPQALENLKKYVVSTESAYNQMMLDKITEMEAKYETEKKDYQILLLKQKENADRLKLFKQRIVIGSILFLLIITLTVVFFLAKLNETKKKANILITAEKELSDKLLLNTLPDKVVKDLRIHGKYEPELFTNASVLFADLVDFTNVCNSLSPALIISELNDIFTAFDNIFEKNHCERIKTAGDAYIGTCGLPVKNVNHSENIMKSAQEFIDYLERRNDISTIKWQVRIGIHTGTVIAGIVGIKKYAFDIFGDIVNTADRLQKLAGAMQICVSKDIVDLVADNFNFTSQGIISVKGKGEMKIFILNNIEKEKQ